MQNRLRRLQRIKGSSRLIGLALLSFILFESGGILVSQAAPKDQVQSLRSQTKSIEARARSIREKKQEALRRAGTVSRNIVHNQMKLEVTKRSLVGQQSRLIQTKSRFEFLVGKLDQTVGETARMTQDTSRRLRQLYMGERVSMLQMILDAGDISALLDRLYYKQKIVAQDKKLLRDLRHKVQELDQQKKELAYQRSQIQATIQNIQGYQYQISRSIEADRALKKKLQNDVRYYQRAEEELLAESYRIQSQIRSLIARSPSRGAKVAGSTGIFAMPVSGRLSSPFGYRFHPIARVRRMHTGQDFAVGHGTPIRAADGGEVIYAGWRGGYGKVVMVNHGNRGGRNIVTLYAHMSSISVGTGQNVRKGQTVGAVGSTGFSTGPHLHFEVRENGAPVDPRRYL
jgi:murein DD-endopeptidase MepM/ murein hydrolase activator NlpD